MSNSVSDRTMVYGRVGFATEEARTAEEAIAMAGLDYEVKCVPAFTKRGDEYRTIPNKFAVERTDTGDVFGTVGGRYTPFQNAETFAFADALADQGGIFESAFQQRDGAVVGLTMRFPEHILIGGEDACEQYLILKSKHDGSGSLIAAIQMVRMMCLNQFDSTIRAATNTVRIPHTRSLDLQTKQAAKLLEITGHATKQFTQDAETLLALPMSESDVDSLIKSVLDEIGTSKGQLEKVSEGIKTNWKHSETIVDAYRPTGWGVLNAVGEYYDHVVDYRTNESALRSALTGRAHQAKHAAQRLLLNG